MDRKPKRGQRRGVGIRVQRPKSLGAGGRRGRRVDLLEDDEFNSDVESLSSTKGDVECRLHEDSIGSQNEFFDDHQKWMIETFDET